MTAPSELVTAVPVTPVNFQISEFPDFATALGMARMAAGLTQEELADRSGLSVRAIRNLETGHTGRPRPQSVRLLGRALGLSAADMATLLAAGWAERPSHPDAAGAPGHPGSAPFRPAELPADTPGLVGREETVAALCRQLTAMPPSGTCRFAAVTGPPGSGRTAVACHLGHLLRDQFPDGQIYVDLDSPRGRPLPAGDVTRRVLRSLCDVELAGSGSPAECAARLRAALEHWRVIVVLDNATSEAQIRPLLSGSPASAVLVAGRREFPALGRGRAERLDVLTTEQAEHLITNLIGPPRAAAEQWALRGIVRACGRLPLALQIAGLWLAARPHRHLRELADRLADETARLDLLCIGDLSLRESVAASCERLTAGAREALARLAGRPGDFSVDDAARLLGASRPETADLLDKLEFGQFIKASSVSSDRPPRYSLHDSVRLYATR